MTFTEPIETHATPVPTPLRVYPEAPTAPDRSQAAATFAEARLAKIAQLRHRIATGTYRVSAAEIADALIRSALR